MKLVYFYKSKSAIFFILAIIFSFTIAYAAKQQNNHSTKILSSMEAYCKHMRSIRVDLIENNPQIDTAYPIHLLADAHCFTTQENLYFAAIKVSQQQLGEPVPWLSKKLKQLEVDAELECKKNKLTNDELTACKNDTYSNNKNQYEAQKISAIVKYLDKRQKTAIKLFYSCSNSIIDKITLLPEAIKLPLAWHMPTNRAITSVSFQDHQHDNDWLLNLQHRSYKDDLREVLQQQCPGEMIYWVGGNQDFDIVNLYKKRDMVE